VFEKTLFCPDSLLKRNESKLLICKLIGQIDVFPKTASSRSKDTTSRADEERQHGEDKMVKMKLREEEERRNCKREENLSRNGAVEKRGQIVNTFYKKASYQSLTR
jgi:hypothetical protein